MSSARDLGEDKTAPYPFLPEDGPVIEAAIRLGDWILTHDALSDGQRQAVRALQAFLRELPAPDPTLDAAYGFEVVPDDEDDPAVDVEWRDWWVDVKGGSFELGSTHSVRRGGEVEHLPSAQLWLYPGTEVAPRAGLTEWVDEVADPFRHARAGYHVRVEITAGGQEPYVAWIRVERHYTA